MKATRHEAVVGRFAARPGTERLFVDLSAAGGRWASIDYGDGSAAPQLFVGVQTSRAELQIQPRGDERAVGGRDQALAQTLH